MEYTYPNYYRKFRCIADQCEETCCAGWLIMIDQKSLEKYQSFEGPFGNRLRNSIQWDEEHFLQYENKRCAFLNEDNLCDIYAEAGEDMLCDTCRNYPRHTEEYENIREISLSLSCPEAARIILGQTEKTTFYTKETEEEEVYEDFDYLLFSVIMDVRDEVIKMLQDRTRPLAYRLSKTLAMCHDVQRRINAQQLFQANDVLQRYTDPELEDAFQKRMEKFFRYNVDLDVRECRKDLFLSLRAFETLKDQWPGIRKEYENLLYNGGQDIYESIFRQKIDEVKLEQIAVYFVYTYFLGSVYDGNLYAKMKMTVASIVMLAEMLRAESYKCKQNDRELELQDYVEVVGRYAREFEHSDLNIETMEGMANKKEAFRLENLLTALSKLL